MSSVTHGLDGKAGCIKGSYSANVSKYATRLSHAVDIFMRLRPIEAFIISISRFQSSSLRFLGFPCSPRDGTGHGSSGVNWPGGGRWTRQ